VHNFHTKISTVNNVSPSINEVTLGIKDRLVEVKTVKVECHSTYTKRSEPNTDNRPSSKEEVKTPRIVERTVLEK
jgi:hypothetical protein